MVGCIGISKARGLKILLLGVKLYRGHAEFSTHIGKHLSFGEYHHRCAADGRIFIKAHRGPQHICVGIVCQKTAHGFNGIMTVTALQGATDNDVHLLLGDSRGRLHTHKSHAKSAVTLGKGCNRQ